MIPSDLAARLRMLTEASFFDSEPPIQGTAKVREIQARLPQLVPGQQFSATLLRSLPDGTFQALVAGRNYTLALSHPAKAGDTLDLIATRNTAKAVYAQVVANPQAAAGETARASLSPTGRLISFLLTGQPAPQPAQLAAGQPLINAPPANNAAILAPLLRQALAQSGLFYEAHQLQWLAGKRDLASLLREPQSLLTPARPAGGAAQSAAASAAATAGRATPSGAQTGAQGALAARPGGTPGAAAAGPGTTLAEVAAGGTRESSAERLAGVVARLARSPALIAAARAAAASSAPAAGTAAAATAGTAGSSAAGATGRVAPRIAAGQAAKYVEISQSATATRLATLPERMMGADVLRDLTLPAPASRAAAQGLPAAGGAPLAQGVKAGGAEQTAPAGAAASTPAGSAERATPASGTGAAGAAAPGSAAQTGTALQQSETSQAAAAPRPTAVPERLIPVVHQQLDAMATQQYVWHAQAWPGQPIEWEIEDPDHERGEAEDPTRDAWNTTLRLTLPHLGGVEARLQLTPAGLALRLLADDPDTVVALDAARDRLDSALSAANVPLTGFVAEHRHEE